MKTTKNFSLLSHVFGAHIPPDFREQDLEKVYEISIPYNTTAIDKLHSMANIYKDFAGMFSSAYGPGYCVNTVGSRLIYHFQKPLKNIH